MKLEKIFVMSQINEDDILGIPFLARHGCKMDFARPVVTNGELVPLEVIPSLC